MHKFVEGVGVEGDAGGLGGLVGVVVVEDAELEREVLEGDVIAGSTLDDTFTLLDHRSWDSSFSCRLSRIDSQIGHQPPFCKTTILPST